MSVLASDASEDVTLLLPGLCDEPLWNTSTAWHTEEPRFGRCAERTVFLWAPCFVLWLSAPFYAFVLRRRPYNPVPWSALAYTKVMVTGVLIAAAAAEGVWAAVGGYGTVTTADFLAPPILLATYTVYLSLLLAGRRRGERCSGVLWIYWLVAVIAGVPQLATAFATTHYQDRRLPPVLVATFILQYFGTVVLFVASSVNDVPSSLQKLTRTQNPSPEIDASFPNRLFFFYNLPLIWRGWRRPIVYQDLPDVLPGNSAQAVYSKWLHAPDGTKEKGQHTLQDTKPNCSAQTVGAQDKAKVSLPWHIWRQNHSSMLLLLVAIIIFESINFLNPVIVGLLISFMEQEEPAWHGYLYAVALLAVCEIRSLMKNTYFYKVFTISVKIRTALMAAVYNKAMKLSSAARRRFTVGEIVNLMAVDAQTIGDLFLHLCQVVVAPFIVLGTLGFVWVQLGPSSLVGLGVMALLVPLNSHIMSRAKKLSREVMALTDARVKAISEVISGIKVLKLYAWEASFSERVKDIRDEEIRLLRKLTLLQAFNMFLFQTTPVFVALATFTCYLLVSEENQLDTQKTFICLTLFDVLRLPVLQLPDIISRFIQAAVSLKRMERYLKADELDPLAVTSDPYEGAAVVVEGGSFSWEGDEEQASWKLEDIDLNVPRGRLVALVGTVGSGKSSILSALLGEMKKDAGKVVVNGSMAYVPQHPWVQNLTLRDNITWGQAYDPKRYRKVVKACALQADFDMLPAGDMTEIGENGINMSGGQKQRVSLARAVYSDASTYLLDDPLSAVDSHVGRHIFNQVVGPQGMLKGKTRILVTHAVTYLPQVDEVVVVKEGRIVERGTYTDLLASEGDFAKFVVQHIKELDNEEAEEELEVLCDQLEGMANGVSLFRQLSETRKSIRSSVSTTMEQRPNETNSNHSHIPSSPAMTRLNSSRWSVASKSSLSQARLRMQRQLSSDSTSIKTNDYQSEFTQVMKGSFSSLNKHVTKEKQELEPLAGSNVGQKLVQEEVSETGRVSHHIYFIYGRAMGLLFTIVPFVSLALAQASNAGSKVWLAQWSSSQPTNHTVGTNYTNGISEDKETFLLVYGAFGLGQSLSLFLGILLLMLGTLRAANTLHSHLLSSVIHFPMNFFDTNPSGRIINRFGKEIEKVDKSLPMVVRVFTTTLLQVVTTMVVIITATPIIAFFVVPTMFIYFAIQQVFVTTSRQLMRLESVSKSPIYSHFSETINGVCVVRAFKRQNEFFSQSLQKIENSLKSIYANINVNRWLGVHVETIGNLLTFAAALFGVANQETTSAAAVGLSVNYALSVTMLLNWLVRTVSDLEASAVSVEKIEEYIQMPREAAWRVDKNIPPPEWPEKGAIKFQNYETQYRPGLSLVLQDITCFIRPAEKVGIVGRTGAGKSSLTMALFRIIEATGGRIVMDNITIASIGLHDLRGQISIIPQDAVLFSGTLRMNLDPLNQHSDDDLWRALELAHLSAYIRRQVLGLQHPVDQGGANFSAGQRQLLCLARALLRRSQVLVLDEATAAVDLETDDLIQATIRTQFAECTVLTIAHRLNTIIDSDRVMVLQAGRIVEFDAPSVLLQQPNSVFYSMAKDAGLM